MEHVVVVGAGQAGVQVVDSLRAQGYAGALTVVGEEPVLPYQRPPLSKDYLAAAGDPGPLPLRAERFFAEHRIGLRTGVRVTAVDRGRRSVLLDDGAELSYSSLVFATGASNHTLPIPGVDLSGVHQLRTLADAQGLRQALVTARSVVVVGAGFIGLEFAAVARARGIDVTVLEAADRPLGRSLSAGLAEYFAGAHRRMGTDLRLCEGVAAVTGHGDAADAVVSASGREYPADLVVLAAGVRPRDELARSAGLAVDGGIVVDQHLRTADPAVYAVGDCASSPGEFAGTRVRLESVQNATDQGRHVAAVILGSTAPYREVPWFWSNQGPLRLQIAGLARPGDSTVVTGDVASGRFSVFCFRDERLVAVESLNRPADHMAARKVLGTPTSVTPEQVTQPGFSLKDHVKQLAPAS